MCRVLCSFTRGLFLSTATRERDPVTVFTCVDGSHDICEPPSDIPNAKFRQTSVPADQSAGKVKVLAMG